jgi:hypothetical protein
VPSQIPSLANKLTKIGPEESNVLLALRAEDDQQWLIHYQQKLYTATGVLLVGTSTIDVFFKTHFKYKGCLRKAPLFPLDKWKPANIAYAR